MMQERRLQPDAIPRHVAIIMDGNGRWAQDRGLSRIEGHRQGLEAVRAVIRAAHELGIEFVTLYAFSLENWNRPQDEVDELMRLLEHYLESELDEVIRNGIRVRSIGRRDRLPTSVLEKLEKAEQKTRENREMHLVFALSYGGLTDRCPSLVRECDGPQVRDANNDVAWMEIRGCCTLGVTWFTTSGAPEADMGMNTKFSWAVDGSQFDVETVLLHENGHVAGLGHSTVAGAVMEATYAGARRQLHQDDIDGEYKRQGRLSDIQRWAGHIPEPTLPARTEPVKTFNRIAGYMGLGEYVLSQKLMAEAVKNGTLWNTPVKVEMGRGIMNLKHYDGVPWVEVSHEEAKAFVEAWESKAVPTIGTGVVEATRLPGITQVQRDLELTVRDLLPTTTTDSDQVEYVRRNATTRAAAETAHGAAKPEAAMSFDLVTSPVRTIAVHMPVQKQQLADFGQLRSEIDNFLLYDLAKREEEQFIYGDGAGVNLEGIAVVSGTTDIETNGRFNTGTDTLIDAIRMGMTDVRLVGYSANAVLIAHEDWETIQLEKATDNN
ncbi:MAG: di-trans,poly-cis-decaprenylcistransferase, partial [Myxococcales bacterium]|nr:di-trans,poly-cis-decaprenylcistransferase [Myxococcales bacterium]